MTKTETKTPHPVPVAPPAEPFPPCAELGEQFTTVAEELAAINRRKAEELARLREIQSRD
jgi:hypothetical protein